MDITELKTKNDKELEALLKEEYAKLHSQRIKVRNNESKQHHVLKVARKLIAQIKTVLHERATSGDSNV
jgi:ribosomal protein L29